MIVYVVTMGADYEGSGTEGVYSTREKAIEKAIKLANRPLGAKYIYESPSQADDSDRYSDCWRWDKYDYIKIYEFKIDED